jgi:hypothetical protein
MKLGDEKQEIRGRMERENIRKFKGLRETGSILI